MYIKNIWNDLISSVFNPQFYSSITSRRMSSGFKFVFALTFLSALALAIQILVVALPEIRSFSSENYIERAYPENLEVVITDGVAASNVEEPYFIKADFDSMLSKYKNLIAIVTKKDILVSDIKSFDAPVVLTKDSLIVIQDGNETKIIPLSDIKNLVVNKENLNLWAEKIIKWMPLAIFFLVLFGILVVTTIEFLVVICLTVVASFITFLVAKSKNYKITYKQAYLISLYVMGPIIVFKIVLSLLNVNISTWITILIFTVIAILNVGRVANSPLETTSN